MKQILQMDHPNPSTSILTDPDGMSRDLGNLSYNLDMDGLKFSERIEDAYKERGWSQIQFAKMLGVSNKTVSGWVNGVSEPREENIYAIAEVLGVEPNEIRRWLGRREISPEYERPGSAPQPVSTLRRMSEEGEDISADEMRNQLDRIEQMLERLLEQQDDADSSA